MVLLALPPRAIAIAALHGDPHRIHRRHRKPPRPMRLALASWYYDAGSTACGFHATYGVANLSLSCGTRVRICYPAASRHCLLATVDDRGPYVEGRTFDLNQTLAGALGFGGVGTVAYRVGGLR